MKTQFNLLRQTRKNILADIESLSLDQINHIPQNFNNNIAWHLGHIVVTPQLLQYKMSGLEPKISAEMIDLYRKGTKPGNPLNEAEYLELRNLLIELPDELETDYNEGLFKNYMTYETSYGFTLNNIEDAIAFANVHEAVHYGMMKGMIKLL